LFDRERVVNLDPRQSPTRVTVDGELFEVSASTERPGQYHFAWLSGPNKGYGFGTTRSDGAAMSEHEIEADIRGFLMQVDPETGYIE
jgi:hypothetical protein